MSVQIAGLTKSFFGVPVLKSVDLDIRRGEVLAIVGENGAGKSTLMNILGGSLSPDQGEMSLDGMAYRPGSARDALQSGIGMVHQELNLFPNLSVAENLFVGNFPTWRGFLLQRRMYRAAATALQRVGLDVSPSTRVSALSAGQQQLVEVARVLTLGAKVLLLDEPTTSLSERECAKFYELLRELANEGHAVVLITHAIRDCLKHSDRVAVLRDGTLISVAESQHVHAEELVAQMVGRTLTQLVPPRSAGRDNGEPLLEVREVSQPQIVDRISFTVHTGEVVGLFGLMGAGRSELARILMGLDPHRSGSIHLGGKLLAGGVRERIGQGLGLITENRRLDGIVADSSVVENMSLVAIEQFTGWMGSLSSTRLAAAVEQQRQFVMLQPHLQDTQLLKTLSGGNQQKVVIGKWLLAEPRVLILDEPTRGIDVGARFDVYQLIQGYAEKGHGVLAISSDLEELTGICDRIIVMSLGKITGVFDRHDFDREAILASALARYSRAEGVAG